MQVTHTFQLAARCPTGLNFQDVYEVEVVTEQTLQVERILEAAEEVASGDPLYQEELTQALADALYAKVRTTGVHGVVTTEVEAVSAHA